MTFFVFPDTENRKQLATVLANNNIVYPRNSTISVHY